MEKPKGLKALKLLRHNGKLFLVTTIGEGNSEQYSKPELTKLGVELISPHHRRLLVEARSVGLIPRQPGLTKAEDIANLSINRLAPVRSKILKTSQYIQQYLAKEQKERLENKTSNYGFENDEQSLFASFIRAFIKEVINKKVSQISYEQSKSLAKEARKVSMNVYGSLAPSF